MLARLGTLGTWLTTALVITRCWARRLLPPSGRPYELFDGAVFLLVYALGAYVFSIPEVATTAAIPVLMFLTETELGLVAATLAAVAVVLSYSRDRLWLGYTLAASAFGILALNFGAAWVVGDWARGAGLSAWVFVNSFRRLMRDNTRG